MGGVGVGTAMDISKNVEQNNVAKIGQYYFT